MATVRYISIVVTSPHMVVVVVEVAVEIVTEAAVNAAIIRLGRNPEVEEVEVIPEIVALDQGLELDAIQIKKSK